MSELDPRERELAAALRNTLEQAASRPDPLLDAALAATRAQIAAKARKPQRHPWMLAGGFALAASLAALLVLPFGQAPSGNNPARPQAVATSAAAMPDADLQLLEDMDMLTALGSES